MANGISEERAKEIADDLNSRRGSSLDSGVLVFDRAGNGGTWYSEGTYGFGDDMVALPVGRKYTTPEVLDIFNCVTESTGDDAGGRRVVVELYCGEAPDVEGEELQLSGITLDDATWQWLKENGYDEKNPNHWINVVELDTYAPNNRPVAETMMTVAKNGAANDGG